MHDSSQFLFESHGSLQMMTRYRFFLWVIILSFQQSMCLSQSGLMTQMQDRLPGMNLILYEMIIIPKSDLQTSQMRLHVKIANDLLQFVKQDNRFRARYEITIGINTLKGESAAIRIESGLIETASYANTLLRNVFSEKIFLFELKPDHYSLFLEVHDMEIQESYIRKENFEIPEYSSVPVTITQPHFYHRISSEEDAIPAIPPVHTSSDICFYAEWYVVHNGSHPVDLTVSIIGQAGKTFETHTTTIEEDSTLTRHRFFVKDDLSYGRYTIDLSTRTTGIKQSVSRPFFIRWKLDESLMREPDKTIEPLQLVMTRKDWNRLYQLPHDRQIEAVEKFWADRDPTPETDKNELKEEFYKRVSYTINHFSTSPDLNNGWKTDRGRVYIIYGSPTNVEKPGVSHRELSRYEIWFYDHLQKRFIFTQRHETGEYILVSEE